MQSDEERSSALRYLEELNDPEATNKSPHGLPTASGRW
jgi:hypothetical protein